MSTWVCAHGINDRLQLFRRQALYKLNRRAMAKLAFAAAIQVPHTRIWYLKEIAMTTQAIDQELDVV